MKIKVDIRNIIKSKKRYLVKKNKNEKIVSLVNSLKNRSNKASVADNFDAKASLLTKYNIALNKLKCILYKRK